MGSRLIDSRLTNRDSRLLLGLCALLLAACASEGRGLAPDRNTLRFPTSVAVDPSGQWVYVASSNFDTGWRLGTVRPFPAARADELLAAAGAGTPGHPRLALLSDPAMAAANPVQIGSFAGDIDFAVLGGATLGLVAVRDGNNVEWFTVTPGADGVPALSCTAQGGFQPCDPAHELGVPWTDPATQTAYPGRDPFALEVGAGLDPAKPLVYVGSILDGTFTVLTLDGGKPKIATAVNLSPGLHSIVEGPRVGDRRVVYASNRMVDAIHVLSVTAGANGAILVEPEDAATVPQVTSTADYFRGMVLSRDGNRLYAAYRSPTALAAFDVGDDGVLGFRGLVPLFGAPGQVATAGGTGGAPERIYVTDFIGQNVYVIDAGSLSVIARIVVGDGPYGIAIVDDATRNVHRAYVSLFEEDAVSVLDLDPASPTYHTEIGRVR